MMPAETSRTSGSDTRSVAPLASSAVSPDRADGVLSLLDQPRHDVPRGDGPDDEGNRPELPPPGGAVAPGPLPQFLTRQRRALRMEARHAVEQPLEAREQSAPPTEQFGMEAHHVERAIDHLQTARRILDDCDQVGDVHDEGEPVPPLRDAACD